MKSIYKMTMTVDNLSGKVEVTDLDLKGKVLDLFIDICRIITRIDKILGEDLSYISAKTNFRMYIDNPFYDGDIRLGEREYKSLFSFRTDICKSFFSYLIENNLINPQQYHYIRENKRFEPIMYKVITLAD